MTHRRQQSKKKNAKKAGANQHAVWFHLTVGPVKQFVTTGRRTRDFWAGSFILSWLTAVAMQNARQLGFDLVLPAASANDKTTHAISAAQTIFDAMAGKSASPPTFGMLPNRFTAKIHPKNNLTEPEHFVEYGQEIAAKVNIAWLALCDFVWTNDVEQVLKKYSPKGDSLDAVNNRIQRMKRVWDAQTKEYFGVRWSITKDMQRGLTVMPARATWRTYVKTDKETDKAPSTVPIGISGTRGLPCMLIDGLNEFSGELTSSKAKENLWDVLRKQEKATFPTALSLKHDLKSHEMLSAVAFVRRRFVHAFDALALSFENDVPSSRNSLNSFINRCFKTRLNEYTNRSVSNYPIAGWKMEPRVPSLAYIANAHWLASLITSLGQAPDAELSQKVEEYLVAVKQLTDIDQALLEKEQASSITCINQALNQYTDEFINTLAAIDSALFYETELSNPKNFDRKQISTQQQQAIEALKALRNALPTKQTPYFAMLTMDGDKFGDLLRTIMKNKQTTRPLNAFNTLLSDFTSSVPQIVAAHNGFLVYVGGEDILAFLPAQDAIACAEALYRRFSECAAQAEQQINQHGTDPKDAKTITASIAINFSHMKIPLKSIIAESERLLSQTAKNIAGRNSLAISCSSRSNQAFEYYCTLPDFFGKHPSGTDSVWKTLTALTTSSSDEESPYISSRFLHTLKNRAVEFIHARLAEEHHIHCVESVGLAAKYFQLLRNGRSQKAFDTFKAMLKVDYLSSLDHADSQISLSDQTLQDLLRVMKISYRDETETQQYIDNELCPDVLLLLRLIANNYKEIASA